MPLLSTIKLLKTLYPGLIRYNLTNIAENFAIPTIITHRAQADVDRLLAILFALFQKFSREKVLAKAKALIKCQTVPSTLITDIQSIPRSPGVYLFYGATKELPLYIGKSISLRDRILSHFQTDSLSNKEFKLSQQVHHIEVIPTAGELSALLLESKLIKEKMPLFNRRLRRKKTIVGFALQENQGYLTVDCIRGTQDNTHALIGVYSSLKAAKTSLLAIVKEHNLCPKLMGLETTKSACFSYQLKRCFGACIGNESAESYNERVKNALGILEKTTWPFQGKIAIKEQCLVNKLTQYLVFDQWHYLGTVTDEEDINALQKKPTTEDRDLYKILSTFLKQKMHNNQVIIKCVELPT
jgi:DNA polymerase-3 subunit epsilon